MGNETKHTPGPWRSEEIVFRGGQNYRAWTVQAANGCVAEIKYTGRHPKGEVSGDEANAAFIVHACNSHDDMLAALKDFESAFGKLIDGGCDIDADDADGWLRIARAAIAKAEEK